MASINYSQNDEQEKILDFFKDHTGRFLDIGAYDGKTISNTYALALKGWRGVCIEPSPKNYEALEQTYKDNSNIINLKIAVGSTTGTMTFYDTPGDFYGSLSQGNGKKYGKREETTVVECWSSDKLFTEVGYTFDFISLDVEQNNLQVLRSLPMKELKTLKLICIEHDGHIQEIVELLEPYGFKTIHITGENIILAREEE